MDRYDAFTSGVEPGGLRNRNEIKTLVCYLVSKLETPVTKEQLTSVICENGIANYFEINQAVSEIIESGNIILKEHDGDQFLVITDEGKKFSRAIEHEVPFSVRENAYNACIHMQTRLRREKEHKIKIEKIDKGFNISMSVVDGDDELMTISLFVADYDQATAVKEKFLSDPVTVYSNIVALLME